jgi:alpha-L-fucosidase
VPGPAANGVLTLTPDFADLKGGVQVELKGGKPNFGFWLSADDTVSWTFKLPRAGVYELATEVAGTAPAAFTISCGDARVEVSADARDGYETFKPLAPGRLTLPAGEQTLTVTPVKGKWNAINLRALVLTPAS